VINLKKIEKVFTTGENEVRALRGVDLEIKDGEMVAITGPSGSGKSTLMNIIGCLDQASAGIYSLGGLEVIKMSDEQLAGLRNKKIGFVFQSFNLLPRTSALENVMLPLMYASEQIPGGVERAKKLLATVGLAERILHKPNQLSGGQQQRVAIARALINDPDLVLADEPTGALDTRAGMEIMAILQKLNDDGRTIVIITHENDIARHCQRIVGLADGRVASDEKIILQLRAVDTLSRMPVGVKAG
jgi:putative ABC transport system ATP-binding protein